MPACQPQLLATLKWMSFAFGRIQRWRTVIGCLNVAVAACVTSWRDFIWIVFAVDRAVDQCLAAWAAYVCCMGQGVHRSHV
jgi:hypothetical protein